MWLISFLGQTVTVVGIAIPLAALAIIGAIIVLFGRSTCELIAQTSRVDRDLSHALHLLSRIKTKVSEGMLTELDTDFLELHCLRGPWQSFLGTLIHPKQNDQSGIVYRTRSSGSFFNRE